jgi:long-subunit fatty acid transport protein
MTMMTRKILILFVFITFTGAISAQQNDGGLWMSLNGEKKLSDKITFGTELSVRLENFGSDIDKFLVEPSLEYRIAKDFKALGSYRYSQVADNEDNFWYSNHRFSLGLRYDFKWKRFDFRWQGKYQNSFNKDFSRFDAIESKNHIRDKFQAQYDIKGSKITPYFSVELYTVLDAGHVLQYEFDTYRYQLGTRFKLNKDLSMKAFLMYEKEYKNSGWWNNYIGGIDLSFDF